MLTWKDITPSYLAFLMKEQKMTRDALAELLGVAKSSVNRWMSKNNIPRHRQIWIAKKLNAVSESRKDHLMTDRYGGFRTEASMYTAQEWEILVQAAKTMHLTTDEFQRWAVTTMMTSVVLTRGIITEEQLPPLASADTADAPDTSAP